MEKKALFNPNGDIDVQKRRMIGGNTTNLNDFNHMKYTWVSAWYRQSMNHFWIPEEINLTQDIKDYPNLTKNERNAYDRILSFLIFLDSIQTANLPNINMYITANEVNLCLAIQTYQEAIHSQSYGYMLDTIVDPNKRMKILYYWKDDPYLLSRNQFIGDIYNRFYYEQTEDHFVEVLIANYILEGIYFYSGFMFFYNLARQGKMPGSVQEIRYINRDETTHLWLFRNILLELFKEMPELMDRKSYYQEMIKEGVLHEIEWGKRIIGDSIDGLNSKMIESYIKYLGNQRSVSLGFDVLFEEYQQEPEDMKWVNQYSQSNQLKTDFFEAKPSAYTKAAALIDDL